MMQHRTSMRVAIAMAGLLVAGVVGERALAHCEVPCGVYGDQMRFEQMLEHHETIAKAMRKINELSGEDSAQAANQRVRWINTKEEHATKTQRIISQYFMTQRIKSGQDGYEKKLSRAHGVLVAAMKAKQTTDTKAAENLREAVLDFYRAYEGREPQFHEEE